MIATNYTVGVRGRLAAPEDFPFARVRGDFVAPHPRKTKDSWRAYRPPNLPQHSVLISQQIIFHCEQRCAGASGDTDLGVDMLNVVIGGFAGDRQRRSDLFD